MTDKDQESGGQEISQPPNDQMTPPSDEATVPTESAESLDKTLELPQIQADTEQITAVLPVAPPTEPVAPPTEPISATDEQTVESPAVIADAPATDPVPPPSAETLQAVDSDQPTERQFEDTSDFTLSDITLSDSETSGPKEWLRGVGAFLRPRHKVDTEPSSTQLPSVETRRWRLRSWQWALIGAGVLVFAFAVFVTVDASLYYDKVHHGIQVVGQDVGGMTAADATETLTALAEEAQAQPITLSNDNHSWTVLPSDVGAEIDVPAAVSSAMALTRENNVVVDLGQKIALYFKGKDLPLEGTIDDDKMDMLLAVVSGTLDVPAVNATLKVVDGTIEVVDGEDGLVVDKETLRASLTDLLFTLHSTQLPIPMVVTSPNLSAMDVEEALAEAKVMISSDLVLTYEGETIATITPDDLITYLDVTQEDAGNDSTQTVPVLSTEKMAALFDTVEPDVGTPPVDATFEMDLEGEEPYPLRLVEAVDGEGLDREATANALTQAAMSTTRRTAEVVLKTIEPERTTEDVEAMGITDLLGDYKTTPYVGTKNRQQNVRLGTSLCSGVFLAPGEEFNTDQRLGVRSAENGWATAPGIVGPGQLEDVLGGGICQVSTTLFNAALLAGLEITERNNHSIFINHYPDGRDATVTAGGKNMRFRNDTDHYIFIYGWSTGINTRFWIWGVDDGRQVQPIKFSGYSIGGPFPTETVINTSLPLGTTREEFPGQRSRSCSIERTIIYADGTTKTESWSSRWSQMAKVIETNPAPTTTVPPTTATSATSTTLGP